MKKIYHLFTLAVIAVAFTACHPLDNTYKKLDENPVPVAAKSLTYTLTPADYKLLPSSSSANKYGDFVSDSDANANIPTILNIKFPYGYGEGSNASITYTLAPTTIKLADSVFADVAYTLTTDDYTLVTKYGDLSDAQVLTWLGLKYPSPTANQLELLTFEYYATGVQSTATFSFLYLNGAWKKIYTITPAQYTSIGKGGTYNDFSSSDAPNLPNYFNAFLKADPSVMATAKVGDVQYVSYKYYSGGNFQRVLPLTFDGTNWVTTSLTIKTLTFVKSKGSWAPDPTIFYTTVSADYTLVGGSSIGTDVGRANYAQYGDFNVQSGSQYFWSQDDINSALILILETRFPSPKVNIPYHINYLIYTGATSSAFAVFIYDGTSWKVQAN